MDFMALSCARPVATAEEDVLALGGRRAGGGRGVGRNERERKKGKKGGQKERGKALSAEIHYMMRQPAEKRPAAAARRRLLAGKVQEEEGEVEIERERVWLLLLLPTATWDTAGKESFFCQKG